MEIIMLRGGHSSGKTTTLNIVYDNLIAAGAVSTNKQPLGGDPGDFSDLLHYNGMQVVFFTMGDFSVHLVNAMRANHAAGIDKLVCACNTRFARPMTEIGYHPHHVIAKTTTAVAANELIVNTTDANTIIGLI